MVISIKVKQVAGGGATREGGGVARDSVTYQSRDQSCALTAAERRGMEAGTAERRGGDGRGTAGRKEGKQGSYWGTAAGEE